MVRQYSKSSHYSLFNSSRDSKVIINILKQSNNPKSDKSWIWTCHFQTAKYFQDRNLSSKKEKRIQTVYLKSNYVQSPNTCIHKIHKMTNQNITTMNQYFINNTTFEHKAKLNKYLKLERQKDNKNHKSKQSLPWYWHLRSKFSKTLRQMGSSSTARIRIPIGNWSISSFSPTKLALPTSTVMVNIKKPNDPQEEQGPTAKGSERKTQNPQN